MDRAALVRIAPFALSIALLALGDLWPRGSLPAAESVPLSTQWWYPLRTIMTGLLLAVFWREYQELRSGACAANPGTAARPSSPGPEARCWLEAILVGFGVWLMWIWVGPLLRLGSTEVPGGAPWPDAPGPALVWLTLRFAGAVLVIPLVEELFWRSYLMRRIDSPSFLRLPPRQVSWFAVLLSAAVFATAHRELLAAFICGVVYAGFYRRHGQLRYVVAAHAVTNLALGIYVVLSQRWEFW